jgi:dynein heavy chain
LIFNFTPSGGSFREKMENHKNLMINSQMIWVQNLQYADLEAIGRKVFIESYNEELAAERAANVDNVERKDQEEAYNAEQTATLNDKVLQAVAKMYVQTTRMAKKFKTEHLHTLYFTPVFFIRTFSTYRHLLRERKQNVEEIQKRYDKGLSKIKATQDAVTAYNDILAKKTPALQEEQRKLVEVVVEIEEEYQKVKLERERMKEEEIECQAATDEALVLQRECQEQLDKIVPCIREALDSMGQVAKYDVAEVRTLDHPPKTIKLVLKAICLLLDVKPIVKKNRKGVFKPSYWMAAIGPDVLGNPDLPRILASYDKGQLTQEVMAQVEDILTEADYTYESAYKASKASGGLFRWVKAIRDYYYIFEEMQPRKDALALADKQLKDT